MKDFPLTRQLGLTVHYFENLYSVKNAVRAEDLEAVLEKAPLRYSDRDPLRYEGAEILNAPEKDDNGARQFRIILSEPYRRPETAEDLLREFLATRQFAATNEHTDWIERARRIVGNPE